MKDRISFFFHRLGDVLTIRWHGRTYRPVFDGHCLFAAIALLLDVLYFILLGVTGAINMATPEIITFNVTMSFALVFLVFFLVDLLYRKNATHILWIVLFGALVFAYALSVGLVLQLVKNNGSSAFFFIAAFFSFTSLILYVRKALVGDADIWFKISAGLMITFYFLGWLFGYPILDAFGQGGDLNYWFGVYSSLAFSVYAVMVAYISSQTDYDPHPLELDEFGNPIDYVIETKTNEK